MSNSNSGATRLRPATPRPPLLSRRVVESATAMLAALVLGCGGSLRLSGGQDPRSGGTLKDGVPNTLDSACIKNPALCITQQGEESIIVTTTRRLPPVVPLAQEEAKETTAPTLEPTPTQPQANREEKPRPRLQPNVPHPTWDNTSRAQVEEVLKRCTVEVDERVNRQLLKDMDLVDALCNLPYIEGQSAREALAAAKAAKKAVPPGEKVYTWAMKLGDMKHAEVFKCVNWHLYHVWRTFFLEPTFKKTAEGTWRKLDPNNVQRYRDTGQTHELKETLSPDLCLFESVLNRYGIPQEAYVAIYDFKFVCKKNARPRWNEYPPGHPFLKPGKDINQGTMYKQILEQYESKAPPVMMWRGFEVVK